MELIINKSSFKKTAIDKLKKLPWLLGKNAFLLVLSLIFLSILVGFFFFIAYNPSANNNQAPVSSLKFNKGAYQRVLEEIQAREEKFNSLFK